VGGDRTPKTSMTKVMPGDIVTLLRGAVLFNNTINGDPSMLDVLQERAVGLVIATRGLLEEDGWSDEARTGSTKVLREGGFVLIAVGSLLGWVMAHDILESSTPAHLMVPLITTKDV
jgi:hypothetical protein